MQHICFFHENNPNCAAFSTTALLLLLLLSRPPPIGFNCVCALLRNFGEEFSVSVLENCLLITPKEYKIKTLIKV